jgi:hypothetical protein
MPGLLSEMMEGRKDWVSKENKRQTLHRLMSAVMCGVLLVVAGFVIFNYRSIITGLSELIIAK